MGRAICKTLVWLGVLGALLTVAGCQSGDAGGGTRVNPQPWNTPAGWEGNTIGIPY